MDIYNALGRTRTLFVGRFLDDESCNQLIASLLWLEGQSSKEAITLYFNSPGALGKVRCDATHFLHFCLLFVIFVVWWWPESEKGRGEGSYTY